MKRVMRRAGELLGLMLALTAATVSAQTEDTRYRFVVTVGNHVSFIDETSAARDGDSRTFWMLDLLIAPPSGGAIRDLAYFRLQARADCRQRSLVRLRFVAYAADGRVLDDYPLESGSERVRSESSGDWLLDYACDGRLRPDAATLPAMSLAEALAGARRTRERDAAER